MTSDSPERTDVPAGQAEVPRRAVLGGVGIAAAAVALTACAPSEDSGERTPVQATTTTPPGPDAEVVAAVADVPVGGAVMLESERLVLTQPSEGDFHAFVAICTHQGCNLAGVEGDRIVCMCHGSKFALDGTAVEGPAKRPLKSRPVAARGADLVVG